MDKTNIGNRMKKYYEEVSKTRLMRRCPVAIRLDGKSFHTFTKHMIKPFDEILIKTMQETTKYLCENIQGCVLGYTQSDEITLILVDYAKLDTDAWFNYEVQKLCSVSASMATMAFNREFSHQINKYKEGRSELRKDGKWTSHNDNYYQTLCKARDKGAMFDSRCFNVPKDEVTNLIYWRQLDATRNSINMVAQNYFSHKELQGKSCNEMQDMLMTKKGINWNNYPIYQKRGTCVVRNEIKKQYSNSLVISEKRISHVPESEWIIDKEIPIFRGSDRRYIEDIIIYQEY